MSDAEQSRFEVIRSAEQSEWRVLDTLIDKLTPPSLEPKEVMRKHLRLPDRIAQYLTRHLEPGRLELQEATAKNRYDLTERLYNLVRGPNIEFALLHIPKWILKSGEHWAAVDEIRIGFEGKIVRILSPGCDAASLVLRNKVFVDWQNLHRIQAVVIPWNDIKELEKGFSVLEVFQVEATMSPTANRPQQPNAELAVERTRTGAFFSYSHNPKDKAWLDRLKKQLKPLLNEGDKIWDDSQIEAGDRWREQIDRALAEAKVAVLLVSKNFLASEFITTNELPPLLAAAKEGGLRILWLVLDACNWNATELQHYEAAYKPPTRLDSLEEDDQEEVLVEVSQKIIRYLRE